MTKVQLEKALKSAKLDIDCLRKTVDELDAECDESMSTINKLLLEAYVLTTFRGLFSSLGRKLCFWRG